MDFSLPDWLDEKFLTESLRHEEGREDIQVTSLSGSLAAPAGSNFGGCVIRVNFNYKATADDKDTQSMSIIVKTGVTEGAIKELYSDTLLLCEPKFYYEFLPAAKELSELCFLPKAFFSPKSDYVIVLEDLKDQGYVTIDRSQALDFEHSCLYVKAAAEFHAISVPAFKKRPDLIDTLGKEKIFYGDTPAAQPFKNLEIAVVELLAEKIKEEGLTKFTKYCHILKKVSHDLWNILQVVHSSKKVLYTINQGDPWIPNLMFQYDNNGRVCAIKLLDFQALRFGSPVNDLAFFLWSSANHDSRKRVDELLKIYLDTFNRKMEELKCSERLKLEDLQENLRLLSPLKLHMAALMLPLNADTSTPLDIEALFKMNSDESKNFFSRYYTINYCQHDLPQVLQQLEDDNVFEMIETWKTIT